VVGTGIWLGVQHLGYPEFGELRRVAQRTLEQRQIVINNLAIRRATAELGVARDYDQICRILTAAFSSNDFDAFELNVKLQLHEHPVLERMQTVPLSHGEIHFRWNRPGTLILPGTTRMWGVTLNLVTTSNRRRGALSVHRLYHEQPLHLDVNLLISEFPVILADALDRVIIQAVEAVPRTSTTEAQIDTRVEAAG
jgi:UDP-GlcNAc:undecaprenyl-phosphate GlcNAc-1-phosphate transferase